MSSDSGGDPRIKIVHEEATRGWAQQSSILDEIRARTGVLLATATIAATLLGGTDALRHDKFTFLGVVALVLFCLVVGLCVYVLGPSRDWAFAHDSQSC